MLPEAQGDRAGNWLAGLCREAWQGWGCKDGLQRGRQETALPAPGPQPPPPHPRCCLCPSRPRFAPGVTIEEDNCCGCNAIAIRRHFLDENMTAVDIVYTSCHDAVRGRGRRAGRWPRAWGPKLSHQQQPPVRPLLGRAEVGP